jgi:hypothetical protein
MTEIPEILVVRKPKPNTQVASEILRMLEADPHKHEVPFLAEALDVPQEQIVDVLTNYSPDGKGGVERKPDGAGGGWLSDEIAQQYRSEEV